MATRNEELRQLMADHGLTVEAVATMLKRKPTTVRIWRCKYDKRQIPEHSLELLKAKVAHP